MYINWKKKNSNKDKTWNNINNEYAKSHWKCG